MPAPGLEGRRLGSCTSNSSPGAAQTRDGPADETVAGPFLFVLLELSSAGLTQLVECQLPKLDVAGSNPVSRSETCRCATRPASIRHSRSAPPSPARVRSRASELGAGTGVAWASRREGRHARHDARNSALMEGADASLVPTVAHADCRRDGVRRVACEKHRRRSIVVDGKFLNRLFQQTERVRMGNRGAAVAFCEACFGRRSRELVSSRTCI
jgi:hypothetical protein